MEEEVTGHHGNYLGTPRSKKVKDKDSTRTVPPSLSRETTGEIKKRQDREVGSVLLTGLVMRIWQCIFCFVMTLS